MGFPEATTAFGNPFFLKLKKSSILLHFPRFS